MYNELFQHKGMKLKALYIYSLVIKTGKYIESNLGNSCLFPCARQVGSSHKFASSTHPN